MENSWVQGRILEASDRDYSDRVLSLLNRTTKEIAISLYLIEPNDRADSTHPVNRFLKSLTEACKRGVRVRLYLNTNFRFRPKTEVGHGNYFQHLAEAGAELATLLPNRRLHDKLIVIDGRYVVEGSMNWSVTAFESNYESVSIIDSREHARKKLERIKRLTMRPEPKQPEINQPLLPIPENTEIPIALFEKNHLSQMIQESDGRTLDLYLILFGQSQAQEKRKFPIDLETIGHVLNFPPKWNRSKVRRQVLKVLKKLENRYKLIEARFPFGQNAEIKIKNLPGRTIQIPGKLLEASTLTKESPGVTFLKLVEEVLKKEGVEIDSLSAPELEKRFGIGRSTVLRARTARSTS